jgi:hypothetical protein
MLLHHQWSEIPTVWNTSDMNPDKNSKPRDKGSSKGSEEKPPIW